MSKPVCVVAGVGPGNGAAFARRFFIKPDDVAETVFQVTRQKPSAWSFEVEARPFGEVW